MPAVKAPGDLDAYPEYGRTQGKTCRAAELGRFLRRAHGPALSAEARAASGAAVVRVMRPGDVVTQDFRQDRLNIRLDGDGRVASLSCG